MLRVSLSRARIVDVHAVSGRDFLKNAAVVLAARFLGRPVVLRIHGGNFDTAYDNVGPLVQHLIKGLLRLPSRVAVLSRGWASVLTRIQPRANITVVPNSVDCASLGVAFQQRQRTASDILLLGNLCARKGHFDALEAASIATKSFPKCSFLFAGAERDKGALKSLRFRARQLGIENNVEFLGPVFGEAKMQLFARSGIFALPSHVENMPVSLMEAMAAGLPVVASKVGAIPEMVEDGRTGILINTGDVSALAAALTTLLSDSIRRHSMGVAGRQTAVERWDISVVSAATESLYGTLS